MATERKSDPLRPPAGAAIVLTVLVPFGCGFYLSYLFRTVNGVISPHLRSEFGLDAEGLGFLTGIYFATFAAMQPVLGVVLDRYGPRRVQALLLVVAAIGAGVFAVGQDVVMLAVGRGLIGVGVSACLMAALKATAMWWPKERLPLVNNLIGAFGSFGALSATTPLHALLGVFGWREVFAGLAAVTLALAIVVLAVVPERRDALDATSPVGAQLAFKSLALSSGPKVCVKIPGTNFLSSPSMKRHESGVSSTWASESITGMLFSFRIRGPSFSGAPGQQN